jgi:hypothetical protein
MRERVLFQPLCTVTLRGESNHIPDEERVYLPVSLCYVYLRCVFGWQPWQLAVVPTPVYVSTALSREGKSHARVRQAGRQAGTRCQADNLLVRAEPLSLTASKLRLNIARYRDFYTSGGIDDMAGQ